MYAMTSIDRLFSCFEQKTVREEYEHFLCHRCVRLDFDRWTKSFWHEISVDNRKLKKKKRQKTILTEDTHRHDEKRNHETISCIVEYLTLIVVMRWRVFFFLDLPKEKWVNKRNEGTEIIVKEEKTDNNWFWHVSRNDKLQRIEVVMFLFRFKIYPSK